ncbi:MAG: hypothetical protein Kow00121_26630 [Elainellaceae cyanobacterium]
MSGSELKPSDVRLLTDFDLQIRRIYEEFVLVLGYKQVFYTRKHWLPLVDSDMAPLVLDPNDPNLATVQYLRLPPRSWGTDLDIIYSDVKFLPKKEAIEKWNISGIFDPDPKPAYILERRNNFYLVDTFQPLMQHAVFMPTEQAKAIATIQGKDWDRLLDRAYEVELDCIRHRIA